MSEEKREEATPKTERRARERGRVWQSRDLVLAATLGGAGLLLDGTRDAVVERLLGLMRAPFVALAEGASRPSLGAALGPLLEDAALLLAPLLATIVVMATLASVMQVGPLFATRAITADGARLDPSARLSEALGPRSATTLAMMVLRLLLTSIVVLVTMRDALPGIATLARQTPDAALTASLTVLSTLLIRMAIAMASIGVLDAVLERWLYRTSLRMSRRDRERERRESEGDEHVRRERDRVREEARDHDVTLTVRDARLVIEDDEVAVALAYDPADPDDVPRIAAMGRGAMGERIRAVASESQVPCVRDDELAPRLAIVPLGHPIPEALYEPVARWMRAPAERRP